jgi:hypothetical protein
MPPEAELDEAIAAEEAKLTELNRLTDAPDSHEHGPLRRAQTSYCCATPQMHDQYSSRAMYRQYRSQYGWCSSDPVVDTNAGAGR